MNADEIRKIQKNVLDKLTTVDGVQAIAQLEIAIQLAELNERIDKLTNFASNNNNFLRVLSTK